MTVYTGLQYNDTSASTLAGIVQDVYFLTKSNSQAIAAGDLLRIINKYYAQLQEAVKAVNENFYLAVATSDLVIGDGSYTYPDGTGTGTAPAYEKVKSIWAAFNPATPATPLANEFERVNIIDNNQVEDPSYEFTMPTAVDMGTYFILHPLVTDATKYPVTGGVKIYYIATQDKLVNDTDVPKIFPSFHDAISQGAAIDVAGRLGNDVLKKDSIALFKKRLEDIKAYASGRIADEIGMVEGQEGSGGWGYEFGQNNMS
jgi:hypothetical protein